MSPQEPKQRRVCSSGLTLHILKEGLVLAWLLGRDLWAPGTSCLMRRSWFAWAVGPARPSLLTVLSGGWELGLHTEAQLPGTGD